MTRVAKKPQYRDFNQRPNCLGRFQVHNHQLSHWYDPARPLMLELGAGRAEISVAWARAHSDWQVLAVDRKSDRLNKAARLEVGDNLRFCQTDVDDLESMLDLAGRVDLIWLAFPDPYIKRSRRRAKHRLLTGQRLKCYYDWLKPAGCLRFKTDQATLMDQAAIDLKVAGFIISDRQSPLAVDPDLIDLATVTGYESRFRSLGRPIHYLEATRSAPGPA